MFSCLLPQVLFCHELRKYIFVHCRHIFLPNIRPVKLPVAERSLSHPTLISHKSLSSSSRHKLRSSSSCRVHHHETSSKQMIITTKMNNRTLIVSSVIDITQLQNISYASTGTLRNTLPPNNKKHIRCQRTLLTLQPEIIKVKRLPECTM